MPNYRRASVGGATYFFTVKTHCNRPWLMLPDVRYALRQAIRQTRASFPFNIDAWVLLPEHMHCIWRLPEGDANFSARWSCIKRSVSQACRDRFARISSQRNASRRDRGESIVWQRRFWEHVITDVEDFQRHVDYVHWNPVKHGHVKTVVDWPYSTFHQFVARGIYPSDWGGRSDKSCTDEDFGE